MYRQSVIFSLPKRIPSQYLAIHLVFLSQFCPSSTASQHPRTISHARRYRSPERDSYRSQSSYRHTSSSRDDRRREESPRGHRSSHRDPRHHDRERDRRYHSPESDDGARTPPGKPPFVDDSEHTASGHGRHSDKDDDRRERDYARRMEKREERFNRCVVSSCIPRGDLVKADTNMSFLVELARDPQGDTILKALALNVLDRLIGRHVRDTSCVQESRLAF